MNNKKSKKKKLNPHSTFSLDIHEQFMPVIVIVIGKNGINCINADRPVKVVMIDQSDEETDDAPRNVDVDEIGDVSAMDYGENTDAIQLDMLRLLGKE